MLKSKCVSTKSTRYIYDLCNENKTFRPRVKYLLSN